MEQEWKEARRRTTNFPRKLDLNLPLLSTRRLGGSSATNSHISLQDSSSGIPFCWEQAPGKPKNFERSDMEDGETPRPRLPPCRWQPQEQVSTSNCYVNIHEDVGCDADVDEDENVSDVFSDAVEVLSLTQAIDIVEKAEENDHHNHGLERLNLESVKCRDDSLCRDYMMERFLPDATALAASSALYASKNLNKKLPNSFNNYNYADQDHVSQSCSSQLSHKGCGLEMFFRWRIKHKLCGIKTPVRQLSPHVRHNKHSSTNTSINHVFKKHF
ncbi:uncharacterized protein [Euphorbia lathyris]|uniref:uncharacterized protein n=1 Tax=Euphorbia lathyris TaxID=212925 RepID=UPI00331418FB